MQEVQELKKKLQSQEKELSCAHRSGKDLQCQLVLQTQTGHAAQKDATKLKVSLYTQCVEYFCLMFISQFNLYININLYIQADSTPC